MKKTVSLFCIFIILFCSSCVNFYPINLTGTLESQTPKMRIIFDSNPTEFGYEGELIKDDGSTVKIVFASSHGDFYIYEFQEDGEYGVNSNVFYKGQYRQKGESIILKCDDGNEIILNKIDEMSLPQ